MELGTIRALMLLVQGNLNILKGTTKMISAKKVLDMFSVVEYNSRKGKQNETLHQKNTYRSPN